MNPQNKRFDLSNEQGHVQGFFTDQEIVIEDMYLHPEQRRQRQGTKMLDYLTKRFQMPIIPLAPIEDAMVFWDWYTERQNKVLRSVESIILDRMEFIARLEKSK